MPQDVCVEHPSQHAAQEAEMHSAAVRFQRGAVRAWRCQLKSLGTDLLLSSALPDSCPPRRDVLSDPCMFLEGFGAVGRNLFPFFPRFLMRITVRIIQRLKSGSCWLLNFI